MSEQLRYEVLAVLGQGGFGTVYHARFLGEGGFTKEVALKVLNPEMEGVAELASRLRDEARVLGLIRHRAIVGVDRLTQLDGRWTVVMEYVEGQDVGHLLREGAMPVGAALEITAEVAGALHAAYTRIGPGGQPLHLLHRDLKPSNIRVTPFGEVKVLDFGIARAEFGGRETKTGSNSFGTIEYMSPERLDFRGDAAPGDVYALGAVLYEALTGAQLGRSSANPSRHAQTLESAEAALRAQQVPQPVAELVLKMIRYDEQARPSAAEVERRATALARSVGGASLREWVEGLGDTITQPAQDPDPTTGSILVERPLSGGGVAADPAPTVWQRAPVPQSVGPRSPSPVRLTPASTAANPAGTRTPIEPAPVPAPVPSQVRTPSNTSRPTGTPAKVALALLLTLLGVGGLWLNQEPPPAVAPAAPAVVPPAVVAPITVSATAAPPPSASPSPPPAAPPAPRPGAAPASRAAPTTVEVGLTGDAIRASLGSKTRPIALPGEAAPGTYKIYASFEGEPEAAVGTANVQAGSPITVHCDSQFGKCSVSERGR